MTSNIREFSDYAAPRSGPQTTLSVELTTSSKSPVLPLDATSNTSIPITITIRQIQSEHPHLPLTIDTLKNIFDTFEILSIHALSLTSKEMGKCLNLYRGAYAPHVRLNWKPSWGRDIRDSVDFVTIPSLDSGGSLDITFDLSIRSLQESWSQRFLKKSAETVFPFASPGTWKLQLSSKDKVGPHGNGIMLWTWGGLDNELKGKKFEYPVETMYEFDAEAEEKMEVERREGKYVQLHPNNSAEVEDFVKIRVEGDGINITLK